MQINMEYTHLEASRYSKPEGTVNIHNNSNISDLSKTDDEVNVSFTFTSTYEPSVGLIKIGGNIIISDADEETLKAFSEWESTGKKTIGSELAQRLHNTIISNCIVEATLLSKEIMLPPPTPAPKVTVKDKKTTEEKPVHDTSDYIR